MHFLMAAFVFHYLTVYNLTVTIIDAFFLVFCEHQGCLVYPCLCVLRLVGYISKGQIAESKGVWTEELTEAGRYLLKGREQQQQRLIPHL